ncbi:MAG: hypothetical protein V1738_03550 [Patescibacteria group bacterium]
MSMDCASCGMEFEPVDETDELCPNCQDPISVPDVDDEELEDE